MGGLKPQGLKHFSFSYQLTLGRGDILRDNILYFMRYDISDDLKLLIEKGELSEAKNLIRDLLRSADGEYKRRLEFEEDRLYRWPIQYPFEEEKAFEELRNKIPSLTIKEFKELIDKGCIDYRMIESRVRVFERFVPNSLWLCPDLKKRALEDKDEVIERAKAALVDRAKDVMNLRAKPLTYRFRAKVILSKGSVPRGEKVRVWIPIPRISDLHPEVKILACNREPYLADEMHKQRTAYFELISSGLDDEVWIEYEVVAKPFKANLRHEEVEEIRIGDNLKERIPHIRFTNKLKELTESIVGDEDNPLLKARKIWNWVVNHVIYTYVHDYALFDNISEYAATKKRGDCGIQAILLITMLRLAGIPARWQSGWYANPVKPGMHDWAQFYVEPYGWVYADPSFGHPRNGEDWRKDFYFGSIEGFRLAFNAEINYPFDPPKEHFRSDPVDSQRGEVEWDGGNLYYDKWDFKLDLLDVRSP